MGINPFEAKTEWAKIKKKYAIPDRVIKGGSFGDKMELLRKRFDAEKLTNVTAPKINAARDLAKDGNALFDEWLKAAALLKDEKFKGGEKKDKTGKANKQAAVDRVKMYKKWVGDLANQVAAVKDPFVSSRRDYDKTFQAMKQVMAHPDDATAIQTFYSQGIRNWLGAQFHVAVQTYRGGDPEIVKLLNDYEHLAAKWNSLQKGTAELAADPVKRKEFLEDMQDAMKIGARILGKTKPK
jgi:hypothetical protein